MRYRALLVNYYLSEDQQRHICPIRRLR